jgi:hypothetical protein
MDLEKSRSLHGIIVSLSLFTRSQFSGAKKSEKFKYKIKVQVQVAFIIQFQLFTKFCTKISYVC